MPHESDVEVTEFRGVSPPLEEAFSDDRCYFHQAAPVLATLQYTTEDGRWWSTGPLPIGTWRDWTYFPGVQCKVIANYLLWDTVVCQRSAGPGDTVTLVGSAGRLTCEPGNARELIETLRGQQASA
jgi:hypothetical protein